jgi:predicted GNAT family acetyltransferase
MTVLVKRDNSGAKSMYEKAGFRTVGDCDENDTLCLFLYTEQKMGTIAA